MTETTTNYEQPYPPPHIESDKVQEDLHQLEQLKRNFTMLAAHELRNPLAS